MRQPKIIPALTTAFLLLMLAATAATAGSVRLGGLSTHLSGGDYNSNHRVFIVEHNKFFGGYFRNSYYDDSYMVGRTYLLKTENSTEINLHLGMSYGYRESSKCYKYQHDIPNDRKVFCPVVSPEIKFVKVPLKPAISLMGTAVVLTFEIGL